MAIVVQTNIPSLVAQNNLTTSTNKMNQAMNRMTTGFKINSAKDDAAGLYVATSMDKNIRGSEIAKQNVQMGNDMISVAEGDLTSIQDNLSRIRDLALTAANGVYDQKSLDAIKSEVTARMNEIDRVAGNSDYNGKKLLDGSTTEITLQVGANTSTNDSIKVENVFGKATATALSGKASLKTDVADAFTAGNAAKLKTFTEDIDKALSSVQDKRTNIGSYQNRLDSVSQSLVSTVQNLTSSKSTLMDADIAKESSNYINSQILQQAASSLLVQANQAPQVALSLI